MSSASCSQSTKSPVRKSSRNRKGYGSCVTAQPANADSNSSSYDSFPIPMPYNPDTFRPEMNCRCRCHRAACSVEEDNLNEEDCNTDVEWTWDLNMGGESTEISSAGRNVTFHKHFSNGTAAIRGATLLKDGQHYWEIKMMTSVYGTDIMIGCGTANVNLQRFANKFVSLLGYDSESWGLSYSGTLIHNGVKRSMCQSFGQGMTIGIHLDLWLGRMSLFRNGKYVGVGFSNGLRGKEIYPMACSTAARTGMRIVRSCSFPTSLQFMCCQKLRQCIPPDKDVTKAVNIAPGLKLFLLNNLDWLLRPYSPEEVNETVSKMRKRGVNCVHEVLQEEKNFSQKKRSRSDGFGGGAYYTETADAQQDME